MSKRPATLSSSSSEEEEEPSRKCFKIGSPAKLTLASSIANDFLKKSTSEDVDQMANYNAPVQQMLARMGHVAGRGLGKYGQGRVNIVEASTQHGRRGLGMTVTGFEPSNIEWDSEKEQISAEETVSWITPCRQDVPDMNLLTSWMKEGKKKLSIDDETSFCKAETLANVLACKTIFDNLEGEEMRKARTKANPFETIHGVFFLNRAAMKMANMDAVLDFMFTNPKDDQQLPLISQSELLYFADICAGPGGFSEYVLWRKKKGYAKGFGFTLKGQCDFKLENFFAAPSEMFEPHYGVGGLDGDGDIFNAANLECFQQFVLDSTEGKGVHFVMADGGFSVDGQENIQEILSKRLYLCQFLCALMIVKPGGHFVCKLFDIFTLFSVGLVYLMYRAFRKIAIFKPVTSRPANSERYIICYGRRPDSDNIQKYMFELNLKLGQYGTLSTSDITQVVPMNVITNDADFYQYIYDSNDSLGYQQSIALSKIQAFSQNTNLQERGRQADIRKQCLELWQVPDEVRVAPKRSEQPDVRFKTLTQMAHTELETKTQHLTLDSLKHIQSVLDYRCVLSGSENQHLLLSFGKSFVFLWDGRHHSQWTKLDEVHVELPRDSILEAEIVVECRGEGRGQRRLKALHIIDAMFLCGEDIRSLHFNERLERLRKFAKAISRPTRINLAPVRVKEVYRFENIQQVFEKLEMKIVKGSGNQPRLCYCLQRIEGEKPIHFLPTGVFLVKTVKEPWMMAWSKSQRIKYFCNTLQRSSVYRMPNESIATFIDSWKSHLFWKWEDGVKVIDAQTREDKEKISKDAILKFVTDRCAWLPRH